MASIQGMVVIQAERSAVPQFLSVLCIAHTTFLSFLETDDPPFVEETVLKHFYNENPKIWTPWIARFAYETGFKCLYSNLPANLSLVTNHREAGENYAVAKGPSNQLLDSETFTRAISHVKSALELHAVSPEVRSLVYSVLALPSEASLAEWQIDFNLRRAGQLAGPYKLYRHTPGLIKDLNESCAGLSAVGVISEHCQWPEMAREVRNRHSIIEWFRDGRHGVLRHCPLLTCCGEQCLKLSTAGAEELHGGLNLLLHLRWQHLEMISSLVIDLMPPDTRLLHLGVSPLLPMALMRSSFNSLFLVDGDRRGTFAREFDSCRTISDSLVDHSRYSFAKDVRQRLNSAPGAFKCWSDRNFSRVRYDREDNESRISPKVLILPLHVLSGDELRSSEHLLLCGLLTGQPIDWLLTLGPCAAAATYVQFTCKGDIELRFHYYVDEDVCVEGAADVGAVLYK
jgi:hypothetical protein